MEFEQLVLLEKNKLHPYFTQYTEINSMYTLRIQILKLLKVLEEGLPWWHSG